jgi:BioD-like phosphotransacetylase family protein
MLELLSLQISKRRSNMIIFLTSTSSHMGKSTVGLCIGLTSSKNVGYFKPITTNNDCSLFKAVFTLKEDESELRLNGKKLQEQFKKVEKDKDIIIVESGPNLSYGAYKNLSAGEIAAKLDCEPIIVTGGSTETVVDKLIMGKNCFSGIKGVIINKVQYSDLKEAKSFVVPALEDVGLNILGVIPSYKALRVITAQDIVDTLPADIVVEEGLNKGIDNVLVGAMTFDAALAYFRRYADKAVVTGGDRAEIMLAAMETSTSCIVATGGVRPSPPVIKKAVELEIPIVLVKGDTYTAAKKVEQIKPEIAPDDFKKLELIEKRVSRHIDLKSILG